MTTPNPLPLPPCRRGTGDSTPVADLRAEFERVSRQTPSDPEAERAFVESKIEMIRNDSTLSQAQKDQAIEELRPRSHSIP
jgi:hypothetical protein